MWQSVIAILVFNAQPTGMVISYVKEKNGVHLDRNFAVYLSEIQYVATTCWFVEAHA